MKKIITVLLSVIICCAALCVSAAADGLPSVEAKVLDDYVYGESTEVRAEIWINNNTRSRGFQLDVIFPEFVSEVEAIYNSSLPQGYPGSGRYKNNKLTLLYATLKTEDLSGKMVDLVMKIDESKISYKDCIELELKNIVISDEHVNAVVGVTVVEPGPEDQHEITCAHPADKQIKHEKVPASCTAEGKEEWIECGFCKEVISGGEVIEKTAHVSDGKLYYESPEPGHENQHWSVCQNCGAKFDYEDHYVEDKSHYTTDLNYHWYVCKCGEEFGRESHHKDEKGYCDICGEIAHEHSYEMKSDENGHWNECIICGKKEKNPEAHKWVESRVVDPTCYADGETEYTCSVCSRTKVEANTDRPAHTWSEGWYTDETDPDHHWHICTVKECGMKGEAKEHSMPEKWSDAGDGVNHSKTCADCGKVITGKHTGGTATCTEKALCEACGNEYGELDKNNHADGVGTEWSSDGSEHWHVCAYCGEKTDIASHRWSDTRRHDADGHWYVCGVCAREGVHEKHERAEEQTVDISGHWYVCSGCDEKLDFTSHSAELIPAEEPYKDENGNKVNGHLGYWYCPECGKYFLDNNGNIAAGPFDSTDSFVVLYKDDCQDLGHILQVYISGPYYHTFVCGRQCGLTYSEAHIIDDNGRCTVCGYIVKGYKKPTADDDVVIEAPVEGTVQTGDDEGSAADAGSVPPEAERPAESESEIPAETNPETGLAMSVIPSILAAIALAVKRKYFTKPTAGGVKLPAVFMCTEQKPKLKLPPRMIRPLSSRQAKKQNKFG